MCVYVYKYVCICICICICIRRLLCLASSLGTSVPTLWCRQHSLTPLALLFTCTKIYPHKTLGYSICNKSRWDCTSVPLSLGSRKGGEGGRHKDSRTMSRSLATSIGSLSYNPDCKIIRPLSYNPAFPACKIIRPLWFILQSLSLRKSLKFVRTGNCSNGLLTFFKTIKGGQEAQ